MDNLVAVVITIAFGVCLYMIFVAPKIKDHEILIIARNNEIARLRDGLETAEKRAGEYWRVLFTNGLVDAKGVLIRDPEIEETETIRKWFEMPDPRKDKR